jgi:hypothetical protein
MTAPTNQSLATVKIAGREYPAQGSQRCGACVHPLREALERALVRGQSPASIVEQLGDNHPLSVRQINAHFKNHIPLVNEAVARYREKQAEARGDIVAEGAEQVATALSFAQRVVSNVDLRLQQGEIQPTVADALKASTLLALTEGDPEAGRTDEAIFEAFMSYTKAIRTNTSAEQFAAIAKDIKADDVLRDLYQRWEATE